MSSREDYDKDEDSLFGSPPPSPRLSGRPVSPALALPSSGCSGSRPSISTAPATQNVGSIALPGSHPDSELPMNPLALSLNHGIVHRPPAQHPVAANASNTCHPSTADAPAAFSQFRTTASGIRPSVRKPKKKSRAPSRLDDQPPKPRGPEFVLPDPSGPPPAHFLRNQENLLGRAGLVAGIKPAALTHARGSTPSNPILIDEEDTPTLGRKARAQAKSRAYIDSSLLTAPTNQEIVAVLIGQKDIFPILEGVLKLVMGGTPGSVPPSAPTGFERRPTTSQNQLSAASASSSASTPTPPAKKRKLNRVPAGATDWDVPYPFQQGEGPDAYRSTWERERGKQLISQLIKLIKSAARKAATKKYLQQEKIREQEREAVEKHDQHDRRLIKPGGHYRPETATYGVPEDTSKPEQNAHDVLQDTSNSPNMRLSEPLQSSSTSPTIAPASIIPPQEVDEDQTAANASFEQFMTSLGVTLPTEQQTSVNPLCTSVEPQQQTSDQINNSDPSSFDQPAFDTWMSFLDSFPISFDGISTQSSSTSDQPSHSSSLCSTPGIDYFNDVTHMPAEEFDAMLSSLLNQPGMQALQAGGSVDSGDQTASLMSMNVNTDLTHSFGDHLLDPSLINPSADLGHSSMNMDTNVNQNRLQNYGILDLSLSQAPSPIASTSSFGNEPSTPVSAGWDLSMPDVYMGGEVVNGAEGQGMWRTTMWNYAGIDHDENPDFGNGMSSNDKHDDLLSDFGLLPELLEKMSSNVRLGGKDKGKQKAVEPPATPTSIQTPSILPSVPTPPLPSARSIFGALFSAKSMIAPSFLPMPRIRQLKKDEIVKRALGKRKRIQEELDTIKNMLWETTVEQAGLVHLARKLDEAETASTSS